MTLVLPLFLYLALSLYLYQTQRNSIIHVYDMTFQFEQQKLYTQQTGRCQKKHFPLIKMLYFICVNYILMKFTFNTVKVSEK